MWAAAVARWIRRGGGKADEQDDGGQRMNLTEASLKGLAAAHSSSPSTSYTSQTSSTSLCQRLPWILGGGGGSNKGKPPNFSLKILLVDEAGQKTSHVPLSFDTSSA